ncbi:MAG TPA: hypothetical protein VN442_25535 [Bryobacteraceae bacterium]|nr:hypothetical protein [Bryobacteraceae bacterium]
MATISFGMTSLEARLDRQMRFWQKRLGLEEWSLAVQVVRQSALDKHTWGNAEWDPETRTGLIKVLDPRDYNLKGRELNHDMECTIVHELVHIQVAPLASPDDETREEVVNRIMTALINRPCPN